MAAHSALAEDGKFPAQSAGGVVPPEMIAHLPDGFSCNKGAIWYRWRLFSPSTSPFGVETGRLGIRLYSGKARFLDASPPWAMTI